MWSNNKLQILVIRPRLCLCFCLTEHFQLATGVMTEFKGVLWVHSGVLYQVKWTYVNSGSKRRRTRPFRSTSAFSVWGPATTVPLLHSRFQHSAMITINRCCWFIKDQLLMIDRCEMEVRRMRLCWPTCADTRFRRVSTLPVTTCGWSLVDQPTLSGRDSSAMIWHTRQAIRVNVIRQYALVSASWNWS